MQFETQRRKTEKRKLIADAELDYVTAWEAARYEQNALRANMEIEKLEKLLNECRVREKNEERVHNERAKFLIRDTKVRVTISIIDRKPVSRDTPIF